MSIKFIVTVIVVFTMILLPINSTDVFSAPACECAGDVECWPNIINNPSQCNEAGEMCCDVCVDFWLGCIPNMDGGIGMCVPLACAGQAVCDPSDNTCKWDNGHTCSGANDCLSGYCVDGRCCNSACTGTCQSCALSGTEGTCTRRPQGNNIECGTCYRCTGNHNNCQAVTANDGKNCQEDCTSCVSGTCTTRNADDNTECGTCERCNGNPIVNCLTHSNADGKNCNDDCTRCSTGSCVNRNQCATAECASGEYCHIAGGDCRNPDTNSQQGETACEACISGGQHPYGENWPFERGTPYCCGDDGEEFYRTMSCSSGCSSSSGDRACCRYSGSCVYSSTCYAPGVARCAPWDSDAIASCSSSSWSETDNCATKPSVDSGDSGNDPTDYGSCIDYLTCASAACTSTTFNDVCTSTTQLTEYYAGGSGGSWDISITCSPISGGVGTNVAVPIAIQNNPQAIETFGLHFTYDTGLLQYLSVSRGSLTGDWGGVDGGDVSGTVTVGGFRGGGSWIPAGSSGTIAIVNLRVISGTYGGGNPIDLCIMNYMDGITGMTPDPYCISSCASASASCSVATYTCNDFETLATGDVSDNPATTGTCTAGNGAGCASGQFSTTAGTGGGTEGCVSSAECFSNGGAGGGNCLFREYYAIDSADACLGLDSCTSKTYNPDTNSNTCSECVGANRYNLGGANQCCGDDASEYSRTCQDGGIGACAASTDDVACCDDSSDCVYSNACYDDGELDPTSTWICNMGTWGNLGITVSITGAPASWQNSDATATVECSTVSPFVLCDPASPRIYTSSTSITDCPTTYASYSPPGIQTISSHMWVCGAARDTIGTEGFSTPVRFLIDKGLPTASINPFPSPWITVNSILVQWSGSDLPATYNSGIDYFDIQYRITTIDGSQLQGWTSWAVGNPAANPGSDTFTGMQNNRTYHFRARAVDNAGNTGSWSATQSVSVDLGLPTCQMAPLPTWTTSSGFAVSWNGADGESGIDVYDVQSRANAAGCGMSTSWDYLNDPDGQQTIETSDNVNGVDGCQYFFRCRSYDVAGNLGIWSAEENTTVDATPPSSQVDEPTRIWLNVTSFTVSWSGSDANPPMGSGLECFDIQWNDGGAWTDWFSCTPPSHTSDTFGPNNPVNVVENTTYSFRSSARDRAGNVEPWPAQPDAYTTIDLSVPNYNVTAYNGDTGLAISAYVSGVTNISIRSETTDSISGVAHNYIEYTLINDLGETSNTIDCGPAAPYGGLSACNAIIDFSGGIMLDYRVRVIDRAGNMVISETYHIGTHPLANFVQHQIHMILGQTMRSKIQVRNMQSLADNVTVDLSGNLPVPPFFIWVNDPDIEVTGANNMTLLVKNLNPNEMRVFYIMIWSPDETRGYHVDLDARSSLDANLTDSDSAAVMVGYPASFPGLSTWAIFVLITLAILGYAWIEKR